MTKPIEQTIQSIIDQHPIVLFMKGTADFPQCGFSYQVVSILQQSAATFVDINVLEDEALRQGIKAFTNWPTIPQLYVQGEFIGGCDIIKELHEQGELDTVLACTKVDANQS